MYGPSGSLPYGMSLPVRGSCVHFARGSPSFSVRMQYSEVASHFGPSVQFTIGASVWNACPAMMRFPEGRYRMVIG